MNNCELNTSVMAQFGCFDEMKHNCGTNGCTLLDEDDSLPLIERLRTLKEIRRVSVRNGVDAGFHNGGIDCRSSTVMGVKGEYEQCEREVENYANTHTSPSEARVVLPATSTAHFSVGNQNICDDIMGKDDRNPQEKRHQKLRFRKSQERKLTFELPKNAAPVDRSSKLRICMQSPANVERCSYANVSTLMESQEIHGSWPTFVSSVEVPPKIKGELLDINDSHLRSEKTGVLVSIKDPLAAEDKVPIYDRCLKDHIDNISLPDCVELSVKKEISDNVASNGIRYSRDGSLSDVEDKSDLPGSSISVNAMHPRKKKKTSTDLVEIALEEDAPLLLKALIEVGISLDEMRLYDGDAGNDSSSNGQFAELESLLTKIFSRRPSLLKLGTLHCEEDAKASYFLDCLVALAEQTRYSLLQNWPVEWWWCRDLQSFIFVFERHNRIVLERPEGGCAAYFFELVDSVPIDWQIKRLVIAMKFASCSRLSLIKNKALRVGDDLNNEEAELMAHCGWVPNSGICTLVNYRDKLVHDWNNSHHVDWRSRIGKLLADGYSGGTIVSSTLHKNLTPHDGGQEMLVEDSWMLEMKDAKLETSVDTSIKSVEYTNVLHNPSTILCSDNEILSDDKIDHIPLEERRQILYQSTLRVENEVLVDEEPFKNRINQSTLQDTVKSLVEDINNDFASSESKSFTESRPDTRGSAIPDKSTRLHRKKKIPVNATHPHRKKKTITDSVKTALEEDAPFLLKALIEEGISLDEMKLYDGDDGDESLIDDSSSNDSFVELEAVINKIFSRGPSLLKFSGLRFGKGAKACYYLTCLVALMEQAHYLRHQRWPVELGWCRDLQSFIFVFERHNRMVLERPEYGYATYFFELVDSAPINWQIKRLVIAMKFANCSRLCLIENKPLLVGEDVSEEEAKVLMKYGWVRNSGIGTMVNYRDRVVHDWKKELMMMEWRSKIGKLLADGYSGGAIVSSTVHGGRNPRVEVEI